jgi:hypothetical protein
LSGAHDVTRLEPLGALQQIKLHGFALIQRAVTILLDGGEMNEDVFPSGPLDKTVSFSPVKPLHCTLLSHNELLSPLPGLEFHILREARALQTPQSMWTNKFASRPSRPRLNKKGSGVSRRDREKGREAPKPVVVTRVSTTIYKTSTQANERRCRHSGNGRNNIQDFSFWQEKNAELKRLSMTLGFSPKTHN